MRASLPEIPTNPPTTSHFKRNIGRAALVGALLTGSSADMNLAVAQANSIDSALASYPNGDMPCEHAPYNVSGACANYDWGPKHTEAYDDPSEYSSRGYSYRNCTDWVAYRVNQISGGSVSVPKGLGNGGQWYANAPQSERSSVPKFGEAAVMPGNPGHVAFVESVNAIDPNNPLNDSITISEYNRSAMGDGDQRTGRASDMGFTQFVNFGISSSGAEITHQAGFTGDWDGDGKTTVAGAKNDNGSMWWYLSDANSGNNANNILHFGAVGDMQVSGDWNGDGRTSVGVARNINGKLVWYLTDYNQENAPVNYTFTYGGNGDIPVTGDWNKSGHTEIGVVTPTPSGLLWKLKENVTGGSPDLQFYFGKVGDTPVTGDWNHDGISTPGIVRNDGQALQWFLSDSNSGMNPNNVFRFGAANDLPVTGDWNGDGYSSVGVVRKDATGPRWFLTNNNQENAPVSYGPFYYGTNDMTP